MVWPRSPDSRWSRPRDSPCSAASSSSEEAIASSSLTSASKAPRSLPSSSRAGEPVFTAASKAAKSAGIVVSASRPPTTLRARSGCTSRLREAWLSRTSVSWSSSRTCRRRHRSRSRRTPRRATTSGVATISTLLAISAPIALASETLAPRSTTVSACRERTAPSTLRATIELTSSARSPVVGREQQPHAVAVRVEGLLEVADGDLVRDLHEVHHAAPVRRVHVRAQVALLEVEVDQADGAAGRVAGGGQRQVHRDGGAADAALGAGDGDQRAAERADRALLARHAVAQRARPLGGGAHARLQLVERERERDDVADAGLHGRAHQLRRRLRRQQDHPDLGEADRDLARQLDHGHGAERVVQRDDVDVHAPQRAGELLGIRDALDDLDLVALGGERGRRGREVLVGDRDQQALAHCAGRV